MSNWLFQIKHPDWLISWAISFLRLNGNAVLFIGTDMLFINCKNSCSYAESAQEDKEAARQKAGLVAEKLRKMKLDAVAKFVEDSVEKTLSYMNFPYEHWVKIRTNNGLERIMKEIRRRTRVVGSFPDGYSAMMLVGARLRHIFTTKWGTRQYLACKMVL